MDKKVAIEKAQKLLRLASDKGATEAERESALDFAQRLAQKYGFRIERAATKVVRELHHYTFTVKSWNTKLVKLLMDVVTNGSNYHSYRVGDKYITIHSYDEFDEKAFQAMYKEARAIQRKVKKGYYNFNNDNFIYFMWQGFHNVGYVVNIPAYDPAYKFGRENLERAKNIMKGV